MTTKKTGKFFLTSALKEEIIKLCNELGYRLIEFREEPGLDHTYILQSKDLYEKKIVNKNFFAQDKFGYVPFNDKVIKVLFYGDRKHASLLLSPEHKKENNLYLHVEDLREELKTRKLMGGEE